MAREAFTHVPRIFRFQMSKHFSLAHFLPQKMRWNLSRMCLHAALKRCYSYPLLVIHRISSSWSYRVFLELMKRMNRIKAGSLHMAEPNRELRTPFKTLIRLHVIYAKRFWFQMTEGVYRLFLRTFSPHKMRWNLRPSTYVLTWL